MNEELERRALVVFDEVIDLPVDERQAAMRLKCGTDAELLALVQSLESASRAAEGFLGGPTAVAPSTTSPGALSEGPGTVIGAYKLLQEIGRGGFGVVYMAEQSKPVKRRVALKVIKLGMDTKEVVARFEAERQALAMMDHPNIAHVFEAGSTETGRPYFVMELVNGVPITEYCDANHLNTRERLELMVPVCRALQSAHQKGIIHRDLKPSNVMVTLHDGKPVPKVIDFGIAKATGPSLTDRTLFTAFHQFIGTPQYMSPEQAEMSGLDIDTRADVYGLGVLLYELLTGTTPVDPKVLKAAAFGEMARLIRDTEPSKPSTKLSTLGGTLGAVASSRGTDPRKLSQIVRGELDWIVMKALEKDRSRRYDTAAALADDLGRYLNGEAVSVGPPSKIYRLRKLARQHKTALSIASAVAVTLVLGVIGTTTEYVREHHQRQVSDSLRTAADQQRKNAEATVDFITHDIFDRATPYSAQDSKTSDAIVKALIQPALLSIDERFKDQPLAQAKIRETLAEVLISMDRSDLALPQAQSAYKIREQELGPTATDTLVALNRYADALRQLDRFTDAEPLAKLFLDRATASLGDNNALSIEALGNYAQTLQGLRKYEQAAPLSKLAWDRSEQVLGEGESDTILAMNNYAVLMGLMGKHDVAGPLHQRVWDWDKKWMGPDNPHTFEALMNYTVDLTMLGDYQKADPLCKQAMEQTQRVLGDDNRFTCRALTNEAVLLTHEGKADEAEPLARKAWERDRRLLGDDHSDTFATLRNYSVILQQLGRPDTAPRLRDVWIWMIAHIGEADLQTLTDGQNYGITLLNMGQYADAADVLRKSLDICRRTRPGDDALTANALSGLGRCVFALNARNVAEAETDLRDAVGMRSRLYGPTSAITARSVVALANLLDQTNRAPEAATLRGEHGIAPTTNPAH